jgi:hypothetical protein
VPVVRRLPGGTETLPGRQHRPRMRADGQLHGVADGPDVLIREVVLAYGDQLRMQGSRLHTRLRVGQHGTHMWYTGWMSRCEPEEVSWSTSLQKRRMQM